MKKERNHLISAGFTLTELMVSIAILAVIVLAVAQFLGTAGTLTTINNKHMDADDQAHIVFDRMADDFSRMVRRNDVDYLFWKNTATIPATPTTGINDAMYFYTEGAGYFDNSTFNVIPSGSNNSEKNSVSLVGYRVNFTATTGIAPYYQLERLGKVLSWDSGAYNSAQSQANSMVFLTYPPVGIDAGTASVDPTGVKYSSAYFASTLAGAYSNNSSGNAGYLPSAVGSYPSAVGATGTFTDSTDTAYRPLGSQVFRFEYSFQLKDGMMSDKPVMAASATNGIPSSNFDYTTANTGTTTPPVHTTDSSTSLVVAGTGGSRAVAPGSRWWDKSHHIGYICVDATKSYAIWHEIGIQDISAIMVTIAVIDKQGLVYVKGTNKLSTAANKLLDYSPYVVWPTGSSVTGNPAYLLDPTKSTAPVSWAYALLPTNTSTSGVASVLPKPVTGQIRIYQRTFYLNNF